MAIDLRDVSFFGPALPEPFVKYQLEALLNKKKLLPKATGQEGKELQARWEVYRRKLRLLGDQGGDRRVCNHVIEPLVERLGYDSLSRQEEVGTREGMEDGGWLLQNGKIGLRAWSVDVGTDLDAPSRRGRAYRFSPSRMAQRVLMAKGERVGLLTDGEELRLLVCDPARPDSHIAIRLDRAGGWRVARQVPDSYRLLLSLAQPEGVAEIPALTDEARLAQATVTQKLRQQARSAVEDFIQEVLDHPLNADVRAEWEDTEEIARGLWQEGLFLIYRLLFVFKLESSADPARAFSFAATSLWRNTYSPNTALAPIARQVLDEGADSGGMLEGGLRALFRLFAEGLTSSELKVNALGGMLFGKDSTPLLDGLYWGEQSVAKLLDRLLWTPAGGKIERERVHYGTLDVEDLGRVYEALLELEPGFTIEPMCRLRRAKLEVVVPASQGEAYREEKKGKGKTKVEWIEAIPEGRFFLRVGLGRKASGSYYTPHAFVRFLVEETLGPQITERSPADNPQPGEILKLKLLDPAMGSGHFLVEACRYLGHALYEACRLCDERALEIEEQAGKTAGNEEPLERAFELRKRVADLPDPEDELVAYLPSRVLEGEEGGLSQSKAEALCRRLVAVHCLYGVDKNSLAVELAKVSLWLESYAEGLPLTFLDHRLIRGDSLTGPFFEDLLTFPVSGEPIDDLFAQQINERLRKTLGEALAHVNDLEASVGKDVADLEQKHTAKKRLDEALSPFRMLAAVWSGCVMLGDRGSDLAYRNLVTTVADQENIDIHKSLQPALQQMSDLGGQNLAYDLVFPEVFRLEGSPERNAGFDSILGNPPWDRIEIDPKQFFGNFDFRVIEAPNDSIRKELIAKLEANVTIASRWSEICGMIDGEERIHDRLFSHQSIAVAGKKTLGRPDTYRLFVERWYQLAKDDCGYTGWIVPSSFHSNEGAAGVRKLYLDNTNLVCCYSFENLKRLFDIDSRQKFAVAVAKKSALGTSSLRAAFYLLNPEWLFAEDKEDRQLVIVRKDLHRLSGAHEAFVEARSNMDLSLIVAQSNSKATDWGDWLVELGISTAFGVELHRNPAFAHVLSESVDTAARFQICQEEGWHRLPLHAGKTISQYTDMFSSVPENFVSTREAFSTRHWKRSVQGYRLAFRMKAASTNERTMIAAMLTPGFVCEQTLAVETDPMKRPNMNALITLGFANSYPFDWQVRQRVTTSLSNYILAAIPIPNIQQTSTFIFHSTLRLTCNHEGYSFLWNEQLGNEWRELTPKHAWPVLDGDDARWQVRAQIDAVVADRYGLDRRQYEHILSTFSHRSYPQAPELCLAAYDQLHPLVA